MRILKLANVYKDWIAENEGASKLDRSVARALLATNDVSATIFITEASFDDVSRIYSTLEKSQSLISTESTNEEIIKKQEEELLAIKEVEETSSKKRTDRKKAVGYVMSNIVKNNKGAKVVKVHYSTMEIKLSDNRQVKVKVGLSRDYHDESYNPEKQCCSWHKEDDQQINQFDYHIYLVENGDSYKGLIFSTSELKQHLSKKSYKGHFANYYFHWNPDGSVTDERDIATPIDVTSYDVDKICWKFKQA